MAKQAPHVLALKAAFYEQFGYKLSARIGVGSLKGCLVLSVPAFADQHEVDRARLVELGGWLEERGYYQCHDHGYQGMLSSPSGWTFWNAGVSVIVRSRSGGNLTN